MNLYLTKPGRLRRKDNTLFYELLNLSGEETDYEVETDDIEELEAEKKHSFPIETIDSIYVFTETTLNSKLIAFLGQKKIPVHFFNYYGNHCNTLLPHAEQLSGDLVIRQSEAFVDTEKRLRFCRALLGSAFHNILSVMQYYQRRKGGLETEIEKVRNLADSLSQCNSPDEMMGIEGNIRNVYYSAWHKWMGDIAVNFKRVYHPPDNPLNALISFLNSLLYTACVSEMYRTALYPGISYLHAPQSRRFSLALDMVEPFKPLMVDRLIFRLFDRNEISDNDFKDHTNGVLMTDEARKRIISAWDEQIRTTIDYPELKRSVSYRQLLRLDCYKLIKFLLEDQAFKPYRISY